MPLALVSCQGRSVLLPHDSRQLDLLRPQRGILRIFHTSRGRRRTHVLTDRTVPIVTRPISLGGNPIFAPLRKAVLKLLRDVRVGDALTTDEVR